MHPRDIGSQITSRAAGGVNLVAAGAGDNAEVSGPWIDRSGFLSAKLVITYKGVLAQDETLSIAANLQDDLDGTGGDATDFGDAAANAVVATGGAGGSTEYGVVEIDVDLSGARQYVRAQFTPDLSAGATDTAVVSAVLVLGGADETPAA